jgi:hypothetical protein
MSLDATEGSSSLGANPTFHNTIAVVIQNITNISVEDEQNW